MNVVTNTTIVQRGDIFYADLSGNQGSEQGGLRPVLIMQNDIGNKYSPTVIGVPITSQQKKNKLPTHVEIDAECSGLPKDSIALFEQLRVIDKRRLGRKVGKIGSDKIYQANNALMISFGLPLSVMA